jgi:IS30 family transposase
VTAARRRRSSTDQHLAARAAELGFASLQDYLADRTVTRRWPSTSIARELGVHPGTVRDRLNQHDLPRHRATVRPYRAIQRQRACWAAKRQARLAELGFASVEGYLRVRRVEQGWSLRRMLAELRVGSAWLKDQMHRLCTP